MTKERLFCENCPHYKNCNSKYLYYINYEKCWAVVTEETGLEECSFCGNLKKEEELNWLEFMGAYECSDCETNNILTGHNW